MVFVMVLVAAVHLADTLGVLLLLVLGLLHSDNLAVLEGDLRLHVTAVGRHLVELLAKLELELHGLEGGRGLDVPLAHGLGDLSDGGGDGGGLSQNVRNVQGLGAKLKIKTHN